MSLSIVGSTVVDVIFPRVPRLPAWPRHMEFTGANLVILRDSPIVTLGGNGANAAFVAARCGAAVTLHTHLGDGLLAELPRHWLTSAGCRVQPRAESRHIGTAINVTAANAGHRRASFYFGGANPALPDFFRDRKLPGHLLVAGWPHPPLRAMAETFRFVRDRGTFTALDAGPILRRPWSLSALRPVLASLDLFLANEFELHTITRARSIDAGISALRPFFSGHLVIKRGKEGALWIPAKSTDRHVIRSPRVRAVSTVGAGDTFNGALLAALDRGEAFPPALRYACATAASVVRSGAGVLGVRPPPGR